MSYMLDARKIDEVISDPMIWSLKDKSSTTAPSALFHLASDKEGEPIWQFVSDLDKSFVNRIVSRFLRHFACNIFGSLALVIWKRRVRTVNAQQLNLKQLLVLNSFVQRCITILLAVLPVYTGSLKFSLAHLIRIIRSSEIHRTRRSYHGLKIEEQDQVDWCVQRKRVASKAQICLHRALRPYKENLKPDSRNLCQKSIKT
jgi:hypothetical protein